ncbi:MAG: GPI inositol-deacylase [Agarilytica sp.]
MKRSCFSKCLCKTILSIVFAFICVMSASAEMPPGTVRHIYDAPTVNGHPGYAVAADVTGDIDKVILVVSGFDTENDSRPEDELDDLSADLQAEVMALARQGWDLMYFEYVDGGIDLKDNADNLARFIEFIDTLAVPNYHLAVVGGSMGGIVARTMFVQEYSDMGVDAYVSLDSPHQGVTFSNWVDVTVAGTVAFYMLQHPAGLQMFNGHMAYYLHYGWLEATENDGNFMANIIDPMDTCAIALSDGESSWDVSNSELWTHNKWYPVSSYIEVEGLRSTYMPYHSVVHMDDASTRTSLRFGGYRLRYKDTASSYFDCKIPNPRDEHAGPEYAILQAIEFVTDVY